MGDAIADEAKKVIVSIRDNLNSTRALATTTTDKSSHPAVTRGLSMMDEADHEAELVIRRIQASITAAERYLGTIG